MRCVVLSSSVHTKLCEAPTNTPSARCGRVCRSPARAPLQNAVQVLAAQYLEHIDILVQIIRLDLERVNQVQLYLLAGNGVACGVLAAAFAWFVYSRLLRVRLAIYSTFLVIPMNCLKTLAVRAAALSWLLLGCRRVQRFKVLVLGRPFRAQASTQKLSDDSDDDEDGDDSRPAAAPSSAGVTFGSAQHRHTVAEPAAVSTKAHAIAQSSDGAVPAAGGKEHLLGAQGAAPSFMHSTLSRASSLFGGRSGTASFFLGGGGSAAAGILAKRRIVPTVMGNVWFVSPFILWAIVVCAINGAGYTSLSRTGGDVATYGIITFLIVRCGARLPSSSCLLRAVCVRLASTERARAFPSCGKDQQRGM